jgi:hypothetical protein
VTITNSCDRAGTIANELPLTEQIPVSEPFSPRIEKLFLYSTIKMFSGTSSLGSFDTHHETVDGDKSKRVLLGLEHENIFPGCAQRYGEVFGASQ